MRQRRLSTNTMLRILSYVTYKDWKLQLNFDESRPYLQVACPQGTCNVTGKPWVWTGRKWFLSQHMTPSELVQTAFKAVLTAEEHETREKFLYKDTPIFDPHYDVEKLVELRRDDNALETREEVVTSVNPGPSHHPDADWRK